MVPTAAGLKSELQTPFEKLQVPQQCSVALPWPSGKAREHSRVGNPLPQHTHLLGAGRGWEGLPPPRSAFSATCWALQKLQAVSLQAGQWDWQPRNSPG